MPQQCDLPASWEIHNKQLQVKCYFGFFSLFYCFFLLTYCRMCRRNIISHTALLHVFIPLHQCKAFLPSDVL